MKTKSISLVSLALCLTVAAPTAVCPAPFHDSIANFVLSSPAPAPSASGSRSGSRPSYRKPAASRRTSRVRRTLYYSPRFVDVVWNAVPVTFKNRPRLIGGVLFAPLRETLELLGREGGVANVEYRTHDNRRTAIVTYRPAPGTASGSGAATATGATGTANVTLATPTAPSETAVFNAALADLYRGRFEAARLAMLGVAAQAGADPEIVESANDIAGWISAEVPANAGMVRFRWQSGSDQPGDVVITVDGEPVPRGTLFSVVTKGSHTVEIRNAGGQTMATDRIIVGNTPLNYDLVVGGNTAPRGGGGTDGRLQTSWGG